MECGSYVYTATASIIRHKGLHDATTTASSTVTVLVVETNGSLVAAGRLKSRGQPQEYVFTIVDAFVPIQLLCFQHEIYPSNTTKSKLERFI